MIGGQMEDIEAERGIDDESDSPARTTRLGWSESIEERQARCSKWLA